MLRVACSVVAIALSLSACGGPKLVDCERIAEANDDCMDDASVKACTEANDECAATADGEVLVLESCPLQFSCSTAREAPGVDG
jgi:hypothetical protein